MLDEAYADFVEPQELLPMEFDDGIIRLRTFSKAYGMAGARIGYALLTERHAATFQKIRLHYGINRNAQIGALASLADDAFRERVVRETARARDEYYALARELGCGYIESRTNFVCIDLGTPERATRVMDELLKRGVWIRKPGAPPLDRFVRVSAVRSRCGRPSQTPCAPCSPRCRLDALRNRLRHPQQLGVAAARFHPDRRKRRADQSRRRGRLRPHPNECVKADPRPREARRARKSRSRCGRKLRRRIF